jgi:GT2 family glycosyltransferase
VIDIVIPNWNGLKFLDTCLLSLQKQTCSDFNVIIVDNGSTDGSVEFIQSAYPEITLITFQENKGFSAAVNAGIKAAAHEWILLLNNDVEVDPECIATLQESIHEYKGTDFFALKMIDFSDRKKIDGAGDAVLRGGVGYRVGTLENDQGLFNESRYVFGACAGAALYRRSMFEYVGLFDEDFFAYLEDVDINMRAVRSGRRCRYLPMAKVYHIGSATSGSKINSFTVSLSTRNNFLVILKNYSLMIFLRFLPAILVYQFFWLLLVVKKKQFPAYINGCWRGLKAAAKMIDKGRKIRSEADAIPDSRFSELIIAAEKEAVLSIMRRRDQAGKGNSLLRFYLKIFC